MTADVDENLGASSHPVFRDSSTRGRGTGYRSGAKLRILMM